MTKSMTEGTPLGLILRFAVPLLIGNLLQQTYNIIDAAIVGRTLGTNALAGVGASSSIQFLVLGFCIGTASGFGVPIAQNFGAKKEDELKSCVFHAAILTGAIAVILTVLCSALCRTILHVMNVPEDIFALAYTYLLVIFLGIPFTLLYNMSASILRSVGDSRTPFIFLAVSTCLNIFLDLFCILVLHWGVAGAAIATIASQALSGLLCLLFILKKVPLLHPAKEHMHVQSRITKNMLIMGLPMGFQFSITAIGSMVMQTVNNGLGSIYISAFTAGTKLKQFMICPFDAFANAVSVFCGQNLGAGKIKRIRTGILQGTAVSVAYGILGGLILIFGGRTLSMLFITGASGEILDLSARYLRIMGFFFWTLGILNVLRLSIQGLGFTGRAVFSGVTEMLARTLISTSLVGAWGFTAVCCSDPGAWIAACLYLFPTCLVCLKKIAARLY